MPDRAKDSSCARHPFRYPPAALLVLAKLPKDWTTKTLSAKKWQDKKEMLDLFISVTANARLLSADYSEVCALNLASGTRLLTHAHNLLNC